MITPEPEENLKRNEMVMGADIIKMLKDSHKEYEITDKLLSKFLDKEETRTPKDFMRSLTFLYTADIVDVDGLQIKLSEMAERDVNQRTDLSDFGGNKE